MIRLEAAVPQFSAPAVGNASAAAGAVASVGAGDTFGVSLLAFGAKAATAGPGSVAASQVSSQGLTTGTKQTAGTTQMPDSKQVSAEVTARAPETESLPVDGSGQALASEALPSAMQEGVTPVVGLAKPLIAGDVTAPATVSAGVVGTVRTPLALAQTPVALVQMAAASAQTPLQPLKSAGLGYAGLGVDDVAPGAVAAPAPQFAALTEPVVQTSQLQVVTAPMPPTVVAPKIPLPPAAGVPVLASVPLPNPLSLPAEKTDASAAGVSMAAKKPLKAASRDAVPATTQLVHAPLPGATLVASFVVPQGVPTQAQGLGVASASSKDATQALSMGGPVTVDGTAKAFAVTVPQAHAVTSGDAMVKADGPGQSVHPHNEVLTGEMSTDPLSTGAKAASIESAKPDALQAAATSAALKSAAGDTAGSGFSGAMLSGLNAAAVLPVQPQPMVVGHPLSTSHASLRSYEGGSAAGPSSAVAGEPYAPAETMLRATPNTLEVGLSGGAQGWLKVRAEVHGESVSATVSSSSVLGTKLLHDQLPALNTFLGLQNISVAASVATRSTIESERNALSQNFAQDGSARQQASQQQAQPHSSNRVDSGGDSTGFSVPEISPNVFSPMQPALLVGSGSWLNVLA